MRSKKKKIELEKQNDLSHTRKTKSKLGFINLGLGCFHMTIISNAYMSKKCHTPEMNIIFIY